MPKTTQLIRLNYDFISIILKELNNFKERVENMISQTDLQVESKCLQPIIKAYSMQYRLCSNMNDISSQPQRF